MADITMPRLSDTMEEGTIASWLKQPGDSISKGEVIAQIETDKATMDLTAFEAGTLQEILAPEGTTAALGTPVARIRSDATVSPPGAESTDSVEPETPEAKENVAEAPEPTETEQPTVSAPAA